MHLPMRRKVTGLADLELHPSAGLLRITNRVEPVQATVLSAASAVLGGLRNEA